MDKLPTIPMSPMPEFGYGPIPLILSGDKVHTLRKQRCHGKKEVCVKGKRTGIVVEFHGWVEMTQEEFLTDRFATADGFYRHRLGWGAPHPLSEWSPSESLSALLKHFYGEVPETMWCNHFRVVEKPEEANHASSPERAIEPDSDSSDTGDNSSDC